MVSSLLAGVPAPAFQAVLSQLSLGDCASLRQVNHSLSNITNQHVPYITLQLSNTSSRQELQQWCRATRRLQHVASIRIIVSDRISTDILQETMQLLSERTSLTQLQLLSYKDYATSTGSINHRARDPTLQPLTRLLLSLQKLVLQGFYADMSHELEKLAEAVAVQSWQPAVKLLVLTASWPSPRNPYMLGELHWSEFFPALHHLTAVFPGLTHLELRHPHLKCVPMVFDTDEAEAALDAAYTPRGSSVDFRRVQLVQVAAVAALANAVQRLKHLETLVVTDFIDIWQDSPRVIFGFDIFTDTVPSALETAKAAPAAAAAIVDATLCGQQIDSVAAAVMKFGTLDDYVRYLLQQHSELQQIRVKTLETRLDISWQRQQQPAEGQSRDSSRLMACGRPALLAATEQLTHCHVHEACYSSPQHMFEFKPPIELDSSGSSRSTWNDYYQTVTTRFCKKLSQYSVYPVSDLLGLITSCHLELYRYEADDLGPLLGDLRSLKHLEIKLNHIRADIDSLPSDASLRKAVKAAAAVQGLQSLTITANSCWLSANKDLLLPLTAAAGGPGRSLKRLKLVVMFAAAEEAAGLAAAASHAATAAEGSEAEQQKDRHGDTEQAADTGVTACEVVGDNPNLAVAVAAMALTRVEPAAPRAPSAAVTASVSGRNSQLQRSTCCKQEGQLPFLSSTAAVEPSADLPWYSALWQLTGLHELSIIHRKNVQDPAVDLPVEVLPAGLKVLECEGLNLISSAAAAAGGVGGGGGGGGGRLEINPGLVADSSQAAAQSENEHPAVLGACCKAQLQILRLNKCHLSRPSILASKQLQELLVVDSSWQGGCPAAAAAWPNVQKLTWQFRKESAGRSSGKQPAGILQTLMRTFVDSEPVVRLPMARGLSVRSQSIALPDFAEIADAFKHLKVLGVLDLPWLSVAILRPVVQNLKYIQRINLGLTPYMYDSKVRVDRLVDNKEWNDIYDMHICVLHPDIKRVQQWLQQQLPWVRFIIN